MKLPTCYVLFSGGLDSRLALKIMQDQSENKTKFKIIALTFKFPFGSGCCQSDCSFNFTQVHNIEHKIIDCAGKSEDFRHAKNHQIFEHTQGKLFKKYLQIIKKPKFGHGSGINPCIDCRIFILNETKKFLKENDFIVTGEVLNERPMSQYRKAMLTIDKETKLEGKILRPLSAKLLDKTIPEQDGLVDTSKLFDINGRSRKKQIELADKYKITYPSPAGGCLLCEKEFEKRLADLFNRKDIKKIEPRDIQLLRVGRHFMFSDYKIIVGRKHEENLLLENIKDKTEKLFMLKSLPGPSVLLQFKITKESIEKAKELLLSHSKNKDEIIEK